MIAGLIRWSARNVFLVGSAAGHVIKFAPSKSDQLIKVLLPHSLRRGFLPLG